MYILPDLMLIQEFIFEFQYIFYWKSTCKNTLHIPSDVRIRFLTNSHEVIKRMCVLSLEIEIIFELDVSRHTSLMHFLLSLTSLGSYHFHFLIIDLFEIRVCIQIRNQMNWVFMLRVKLSIGIRIDCTSFKGHFDKVRTFWEAHKNLRNLPHALYIYLVKCPNHEEDFLNFVCFSESPNFIDGFV